MKHKSDVEIGQVVEGLSHDESGGVDSDAELLVEIILTEASGLGLVGRVDLQYHLEGRRDNLIEVDRD